MADWITANGLHIAFASKKGFPAVIVSETPEVDGDKILVPLTESQVRQIQAAAAENPYAAAAPGQLGAVRAPYQFKGPAVLAGASLKISVEEIYCTKPGAEAGIRLDTLGYEKMKEYEESRWTDLAPRA
jgi:hypothetical protein